MCTLCAQFVPFEKDCAFPIMQILTESSDASGTIPTNATMSVGDTFVGDVTYMGDRDYVAVTLEAGQVYDISLNGTSLSDPLLRLLNGSGTQIAMNDDHVGTDSFLRFTPTTSGTYYLVAGAYNDSVTGSYQLAINTVSYAPDDVYTLDQIATQLTETYWGGYQTRFDFSGEHILTYDVSLLTSAEQRLAVAALEAWSSVTDLTFSAAPNYASADIRFDNFDSGAYTTTTTTWRGDFDEIQSALVNISSNWITYNGSSYDSYSFQTYIHEIGHALGLGHAGDYNIDATYGTDNDFANDSWQATVMSYFSQTDNFTILADYAYVITPMMGDIVAIQELYGAPSSSNAGDTVYGYNSNVSGYLGDVFGQLTGEDARRNSLYIGDPVTFTVFDTGGIDTLDFSGAGSTAFKVDMAEEGISDVFGVTGSMSIARGTVIEKLRLADGNDQVTGNDADNTIHAGGGNDTIDAGLGNDRVGSGAGADSILGGAGEDTLNGHAGNDTIDGGTDADFIRGGSGLDLITGGDGPDTIYAHSGNDTIDAGAGDDVVRAHGDDDSVQGGLGNDSINGGCGNDTLDGGNDNDSLFGAPGDDILLGGEGDDSLFGGSHADSLNGGIGNDMLRGDNGNDTLIGDDGNDSLSGGLHADSLDGGAGDDILLGGNGNDTLLGGAGVDTLDGGEGADYLAGNGSGDVFIFALGYGDDRIADFTQGADVLSFDEALWGGGLTAADMIAAYVTQAGGETLFDFGADTLVLVGAPDLGTLSDDIVFA